MSDYIDEEELLGEHIKSANYISLYFGDLKSELLTAEMEKRLFRELQPCREKMYQTFKDKIHTCHICESARKRVITSNLKYVVRIAKKYLNRGMPLLDLIQEGNIGLIRAVNRFDAEKGYRFTTYSTAWIHQAIDRALEDKGRSIRLPINKVAEIKKVLYRYNREGLEKESMVSFLERNKYEDLMGWVRDLGIFKDTFKSLDEELGQDDNKRDIYFVFEDKDIESPDHTVLRKDTKEQLRRVIQELPDEMDRDIISRRFGLLKYCGEVQTLKEVGEIYGVTTERIRQREKRSLKRMGKYMRDNKQFKDLVVHGSRIYEKNSG